MLIVPLKANGLIAQKLFRKRLNNLFADTKLPF